MSKVVHCRRRRDSPSEVYIGRPSPFGNPFVIGRDGDRREVIQTYEVWFLHRVEVDPQFRLKVLALRGKDLACWCSPLPCHGDVILRWLEENM